MNFLLGILSRFRLLFLSNIGLLTGAERLRAVVDQLLAQLNVLQVRVGLNLLDLGCLPRFLFSFVICLALSLSLLVLCVAFITFFLDLSTLLIALLKLSLVLGISLSSFHESFSGLIEPHDVSDQLLLNLVLDHLGVIRFLGSVFISFHGSDLGSNLNLLVFNLLKILLVGLFGRVDGSLLAFDFLDTLLDGVEHLVEGGQLFRVLLLLGSQLVNPTLKLLLLDDHGSRIFYLRDFLN